MTGISIKTDDNTQGYDLELEIEHDSDGRISQGIKLAETTHQNQAMILIAHPGDLKEHPTAGVGLEDIVHDHELSHWKKVIREQIEADGQRINRLRLTQSGLDLDAEYK